MADKFEEEDKTNLKVQKPVNTCVIDVFLFDQFLFLLALQTDNMRKQSPYSNCKVVSQDSPNVFFFFFSDYQSFVCRALLKNQTFNSSLYDTNTESYKAMSESIKTEVSCCSLICHHK